MFHWEKLIGMNNNLKGVIWNDILELTDLKLNIDDLESFFAKRKKNMIKRSKKKSVDDAQQSDQNNSSNPRKIEKLRLPDQKQTQNIEIMLRRIPHPSVIVDGTHALFCLI